MQNVRNQPKMKENHENAQKRAKTNEHAGNGAERTKMYENPRKGTWPENRDRQEIDAPIKAAKRRWSKFCLSPGPRSWQFTIWKIIVTDREKATALSYALPSPGGLCFEIVTGTALLRWRLTFGSVAGA